MKSFAGVFETHLTVRPGFGEENGTLARWAGWRGMKYAEIVLDTGATPRQPMVTYHGPGTLASQLATARRRTGELRGDGFDVIRVKVEAAPSNEGVPRSAAAAAALGTGCYFEHHVKLDLPGDSEVELVRRIGARHGGHVSRNARRRLHGGRHQRFLTQRCAPVGREEARSRLSALLDELADAGHRVIEVEEEFVVYDDNPGLDRGWGRS